MAHEQPSLDFYLQLFINVHGLSANLAFYSVGTCGICSLYAHSRPGVQLATLNAASFFGRNILNFLADTVGQFNITCPVSVVSTALVFVLYGATTPGGAIAFAILYGFFSGGCELQILTTWIQVNRSLSRISAPGYTGGIF